MKKGMPIIENFEIKHKDFERTLGIFRSMTRKPLSMKVVNKRADDRASLTVNEDYMIEIPSNIFGKENYETYFGYVLFEHEIAHVLFRTDFDMIYKWYESKKYTNIAQTIGNIVEDERVDFLWRKLYTTPFRYVWTWFRGDIEPQSPIDILLDVRCGRKILDTDKYIEIYDTLEEMIKGVHDNIYVSSTIRTSEKIYNYIVSLMQDEDEKKQQNQQAQSGAQSQDGTSEQKSDATPQPQDQPQQEKTDKEDSAEELDREIAFMKRNQMTVGSNMPEINLGVKSKNITPEQEKERTQKIIEALKSQMAHTNTRETPESKMSILGGVDSSDFKRSSTPVRIEKHPVTLDIKAIDIEWIDDEGEYLDIEEIIHKRLTNDFQASTMIDEIEGLGMHVLFLLDYSGSMKTSAGFDNKTKVEVLASIVWSLWNELLLIPGCKVEAILYSGFPLKVRRTGKREGLSGVRVDSPTELLYHRPNGGTNSATALEYAYNVMTSRSERGVIIHITDGDAFDKVETGKVLRKIQDEGVPVFNIFITRNKKVEYSKNAHYGSFVTVDLRNLASCIKSSIVPILQNYLREIT